jgi:glycosyl transferase family 25
MDRREQIEKELDNFDLKYERFEAIETPDFGTLGCELSHLAVLKLAKERQYKNILILEDDFSFLVEKEEFENNLRHFFEQKIDYNVCMISYNLLKKEETDYEFLWKSLDVQTGSGYIVNANYFDVLIELFEKTVPLLLETQAHWLYALDQIWKPLQLKDKWYCFKTRIGKQRPSYSNNTNSFANYKDC